MQRDATTKQPNKNRMSTKSNTRDMRDPFSVQSAPEAPFLTELFNKLNEEKIEYCVLRNYETLPYSLAGSDIDLLVARQFFNKAVDIIHNVASLHGGRCISRYSVSGLIFRFCGKDDHWWGAAIDIYPSLEYRGVAYFDVSELLEYSQEYRNIRVTCHEDAAIVAFLKECLANGKSRKNYKEEAATAYMANETRYEKMLQKFFGTRVALQWQNYLLPGYSNKTLRRISRNAIWALCSRAFIHNPFTTLWNKCEGFRRRYARLFCPPGIAVAILGTDGAGKSTIIEHIRPVLKTALHGKIFYEHMRPNLLPSLARLFGRPVKEGPTTDPHADKPSGFLGSLVRLSYYTVDYVIGYWIKVFPALVKRPCMYVFDRYFYDYHIDPYRSLISSPRWITKALSLFIPKPDIILCLGADPEIIHARKPELPLEEFKRQIKALRQFCDKNKRAVWIDTGCSIEESVNQALEAITTRMAARYE